MNWYCIEHGQNVGPMADTQLDERAHAGQLAPDSLVWREGMTEWQPYGRVRSGTPPGAPDRATGHLSCALCSKSFPPDEVIAFESAWVCAACKPLLLQRVREGLSVGHASINTWRDGELVVAIPGSTLTGRCVKCNGVESLSQASTTLYWHPRWIYALLLLTPVAYWLALLPTQKCALVSYSFCRLHRKQRGMLITACLLIALIAFGIGAASAAYSSFWLVVVAGTVLAGGAVLFRGQWNQLFVAKIEGDYVWLRGCGRGFVDALPEFNPQRAVEVNNARNRSHCQREW